MSTETEIAKENVIKLKLSEKDIRSIIKCETHLASLKRELEFLEEKVKWHEEDIDKFEERVDDIMEAIKVYEDNLKVASMGKEKGGIK